VVMVTCALALIAPAKLIANIAICSFFMFPFLISTLAESDFWPDIQTGILSFIRLPYCCLFLNRPNTVPIFTEQMNVVAF